jgi:hypothetical protein
MADNSFDFEVEIYGGKRKLTVTYSNAAKGGREFYFFGEYLNEKLIKDLVPKAFMKIVLGMNHAYARALGYKDAADLERNWPTAMPYTRLKDWLKIQRKMIASPNVSQWSESSADMIFGSDIKRRFRLDRHNDTLLIGKRLLGAQYATLLESAVSSTPTDKAEIFLQSLLGIIAAFNLEHVYVNIDVMNAVGSSGTVVPHGWRAYHDVWDPTLQNISYTRGKMETALNSEDARTKPINLNIDYIKVDAEGGGYENVYGVNMSLLEHIIKTFIHEASHMWVATEDHYYWRPSNGTLSAHASLSTAPGVSNGTKLLSGQVETERSILNADTYGWFLYWWGHMGHLGTGS